MIDYHVHLWPHPERADEGELALERIARYTEEAARAGVGEIALTEHIFRFVQGRAVTEGWWRDWPEWGGLPLYARAEAYYDHHATVDLDHYVATALAAKEAGLPVIVGLEVDYVPGRMEAVSALLAGYPFDVLLGSVHALENWLFDDLSDATQMAVWESRPLEEIWRAYAGAMEELAATKSCDVLAHPDLVKVAARYPDRGVIDECEERIADAAAGSGMAAEISSAGSAKPCGEDYPSPSLLARLSRRNVPITFASDSHGPARVGERNAALLRQALAAGYRSVRRFRGRQATDADLCLPGSAR